MRRYVLHGRDVFGGGRIKDRISPPNKFPSESVSSQLFRSILPENDLSTSFVKIRSDGPSPTPYLTTIAKNSNGSNPNNSSDSKDNLTYDSCRFERIGTCCRTNHSPSLWSASKPKIRSQGYGPDYIRTKTKAPKVESKCSEFHQLCTVFEASNPSVYLEVLTSLQLSFPFLK
ncbi:hypothetical protein HY990_03835 [Candidatus Micrarchaeota archaeon]|nr:hypothetical protein [Candidatus Micrarchaeota archaeon]